MLYFLLGLALLMGASAWLGQFLGNSNGVGHEKLAIVEIVGFISDSREVVRQIRKFREDDSIHGIILRIDSPGGAVAPSQEIYREVLRTRKSGAKKIFVSMGTVAASGGYYIAAPADRIFANPGTLTGSIGVVMAFTNLEGLMGKIGLRPEIVKAGKFKDTGSPARKMRPYERKYLEKVVGDVHKQFIAAVAKGRHLSLAKTRKLADGRIFTGRQAVGLKLVDQLGGLEDTIEAMGKLLGAEGRPRVVQESPDPGLVDWLLRSKVAAQIKTSLLTSGFPGLHFLWTPGNGGLR